jgi:microcystin-dependent protein
MFGGNFAPVGWFLCQGQSLPISSNETLFNLIGTTYGGNGTTTFNLPNLQSRFPMHQGTSRSGQTYVIGQPAGTEAVTVISNQLPSHAHIQLGQTVPGTATSPSGGVPATPSPADNWYTTNPPVAAEALASPAMTTVGNSLPHDNMQPFLVINFIIAWAGIYPQQG